MPTYDYNQLQSWVTELGGDPNDKVNLDQVAAHVAKRGYSQAEEFGGPETLYEAGKRGFKESFEQVPMLGAGLIAGGGAVAESALGEGGLSTAAKEWGVKKYNELGEDMAKDAKPEDSIDYSYDKAVNEGDLGALMQWGAHGLGYTGGQALQSLATFGVGKIAGQMALKTGVESFLTGQVAKAAEEIAIETAGKSIAKEELQKMAVKRVASTIGANAAVGAQAFGLEGGEIGAGLASQSSERGTPLTGEEVVRGGAATIVAGGLEYAGKMLEISGLTGGLPKLGAESVKGIGGKILRGGIGAAEVGGGEGAQEYLQTMAEQYGQGEDTTTPKARAEQREAGALGVLSGASGGVGGLISGPKASAQKLELSSQKVDIEQADKIMAAPSVDEAIQEAAASTNVHAADTSVSQIYRDETQESDNLAPNISDEDARAFEQKALFDNAIANQAIELPDAYELKHFVAEQKAEANAANQAEQDRLFGEKALAYNREKNVPAPPDEGWLTKASPVSVKEWNAELRDRKIKNKIAEAMAAESPEGEHLLQGMFDNQQAAVGAEQDKMTEKSSAQRNLSLSLNQSANVPGIQSYLAAADAISTGKVSGKKLTAAQRKFYEGQLAIASKNKAVKEMLARKADRKVKAEIDAAMRAPSVDAASTNVHAADTSVSQIYRDETQESDNLAPNISDEDARAFEQKALFDNAIANQAIELPDAYELKHFVAEQKAEANAANQAEQDRLFGEKALAYNREKNVPAPPDEGWLTKASPVSVKEWNAELRDRKIKNKIAEAMAAESPEGEHLLQGMFDNQQAAVGAEQDKMTEKSSAQRNLSLSLNQSANVPGIQSYLAAADAISTGKVSGKKLTAAQRKFYEGQLAIASKNKAVKEMLARKADRKVKAEIDAAMRAPSVDAAVVDTVTTNSDLLNLANEDPVLAVVKKLGKEPISLSSMGHRLKKGGAFSQDDVNIIRAKFPKVFSSTRGIDIGIAARINGFASDNDLIEALKMTPRAKDMKLSSERDFDSADIPLQDAKFSLSDKKEKINKALEEINSPYTEKGRKEYLKKEVAGLRDQMSIDEKKVESLTPNTSFPFGANVNAEEVSQDQGRNDKAGATAGESEGISGENIHQPSEGQKQGSAGAKAKITFAEPIKKDELINGITRSQAGRMLAEGDHSVVDHIKEGISKHGIRPIEDAILNQSIAEVQGVAKSERPAVRENIAKLEPDIKKVFEEAHGGNKENNKGVASVSQVEEQDTTVKEQGQGDTVGSKESQGDGFQEVGNTSLPQLTEREQSLESFRLKQAEKLLVEAQSVPESDSRKQERTRLIAISDAQRVLDAARGEGDRAGGLWRDFTSITDRAFKMKEQQKKEAVPVASTTLFSRSASYADPNAEDADKIQEAVEGKDLISVAKWVRDNAGDKDYAPILDRAIAKITRSIANGFTPSFEVIHVGDKVFDGSYRGRAQVVVKGNDISVYANGNDVTGKVGMSYETLTHEIVHAATMQSLMENRANNTELYRDVKELSKAVSGALEDHLSRYKEGDTIPDFIEKGIEMKHNAFTSEDELIAWSFANKDMQSFMESVPYAKKGGTIWSEFVALVRRLLGLSKKSETALSEVLRIGSQLMDEDALRVDGLESFNKKHGLETRHQMPVGQSMMVSGEEGQETPAIAALKGQRQAAIAQKNLAQDEQDIIRRFPGKDKISAWNRVIEPIEELAKREPKVKKLWNAIRDRTDMISRFTHKILGPEGVGVLETLSSLKDIKPVQDYLVNADKYESRYKIRESKDGWTVTTFDKDKNLLSTDKFEGKNAEDAAVAYMTNKESEQLEKDGFSEENIRAIAEFRLATDRELRLKMAGIRESINSGVGEKFIEVKNDDGKTERVSLPDAVAQLNEIRGNYFPRQRNEGDYVLRGIDKNGNQRYMNRFDMHFGEDDTKREDNLEKFKRMVNYGAAKLGKAFTGVEDIHSKIKDIEGKGWDYKITHEPKMTEDVFEPAHLISSIDQLMKAAEGQAKGDQATQAIFDEAQKMVISEIAKMFQMRGALRANIGRLKHKGQSVIEGYETNPIKAIATSARATSSGIAKRIVAEKAMRIISGTETSWNDYKAENPEKTYADYRNMVREESIDAKTTPQTYATAMDTLRWSLRNSDKLDRAVSTLKGLATLKYLGLRVSSAAINVTNMVTGVPATFHAHGISFSDTAKHLTRGAWAYVHPSGRTAKESAMMEYIKDQGWDTQNFHQAAASALESKASGWQSSLMNKAMFMFSITERMNRCVTIMAAYEGLGGTFDKGKIDQEIMEKARDISDEAHGSYQKETIPQWLMGNDAASALARSGYTFMKFTHNYLLNLKRYGFEDRKAAMWMLASPTILAGAGANALTPIAMMLWGAAGEDDPEEKFYKFMDKYISKDLARVGVLGKMGVDIRGSLGQKYSLPTTVAELLGAPAAVIGDVYKGVGKIKAGDVRKGIEDLLPNGVSSLSKAEREYNAGVTSASGQKVLGSDKKPLKGTLFDAFVRGMSFSPTTIAVEREKAWNEKKKLAAHTEIKAEIYGEMRRYMNGRTREPGEWARILNSVVEYNDKIMESGGTDLILPKTIDGIYKKMDTKETPLERRGASKMFNKYRSYEVKKRIEKKRSIE